MPFLGGLVYHQKSIPGLQSLMRKCYDIMAEGRTCCLLVIIWLSECGQLVQSCTSNYWRGLAEWKVQGLSEQHRKILSQTLLRWGSRVIGIQFSGWVLMKPRVPSSASEMMTTCSQAQWSTPVIIELGRWRNLDQMLMVILSYTVSLGPLISTWACKWKFPERSCMCKSAIRAL